MHTRNIFKSPGKQQQSGEMRKKTYYNLSSITKRIQEILQPHSGKLFWVKAEISSGRERGGSFYCDLVETDETGLNGQASTTLTPAAGTNTVTATVAGLTGSPVTFTAEGGVIKIFSLITTATTNTNTIGFVLEGTGITTAHELGTAVGNCDLVSKWVVETQSYLSHPMSVETYNNFSLEIGSDYFVSVTSDHDFTFTGTLPGSIVKTLSTTDTTNTNAVGLPYSKSGILNAHELGQDIGNCDLISKWVVETQSYLSHPMSVETYNNFDIECGQGYFISITENTSWSW